MEIKPMNENQAKFAILAIIGIGGILLFDCAYLIFTPRACYAPICMQESEYNGVSVCYYDRIECDVNVTFLFDGFYSTEQNEIWINRKGWFPNATLVHEYCHYLGGDELKCYLKEIEFFAR